MNNTNFKHFIKELKTKNCYLNCSRLKIHNIKVDKNLFFNKQIFSSNLSFETDNKFSVAIDSLSYTIYIKFSRTNTFLQVSTFNGIVRYFCSAGTFLKGKQKISRSNALKIFFQKLLSSQLNFLNGKHICLRLLNVNDYSPLIIDYLEKKLFIKSIIISNTYPHNGCRKKKIKNRRINRSLMI